MTPDGAHTKLRPWIPDALAKYQHDPEALERVGRYVVVEEIVPERYRVLDSIRTMVSAWPGITEDGQLVFAHPEEAIEYVDDRDAIEELLARRRIVRADAADDTALAQRDIEVGDVYAIVVFNGDEPGNGGGPPGSLLVALRDDSAEFVIYDISREARLAATATYSSATAGALSPEDAARFFDDGEDKPQKGGGPTAPVTPGGGDPSGGAAQPQMREEADLPVEAVASEAQQAKRRVASAGA